MVKYTHIVTLLPRDVAGIKFKCAIVGEQVYCGEFTHPDGTTYSEPEVYEHDSGVENLTPELWYDDTERWSVKKLIQFKGNK